MSDSVKREITFIVPEEDVLVSYRYLLLMTLGRFEKLHNEDSVPMQQDLLDGSLEDAIQKIENYQAKATELVEHLDHVLDLVRAEMPKKRAKKTKK
jgi:preprotein translocase subunit SecA